MATVVVSIFTFVFVAWRGRVVKEILA